MSRKFHIQWFVILISFCLCSCNRQKIDLHGVTHFVDNSIFRGIEPDILFSDLCDIVGEPNEYQDEGSGSDKEHNPVYYFADGKIICHWSGNKKDEIGVIEYLPYLNKPLPINKLIDLPLYDYNITEQTKIIRVYEGEMLYYIIHLDNLKVEKITYWLVQKKFLNVAY